MQTNTIEPVRTSDDDIKRKTCGPCKAGSTLESGNIRHIMGTYREHLFFPSVIGLSFIFTDNSSKSVLVADICVPDLSDTSLDVEVPSATLTNLSKLLFHFISLYEASGS